MLSRIFLLWSAKSTLLISSVAMLTLMSACSAPQALRVSQIPVRPDLSQCVGLRPTQSEERPQIAPDPDFSGALADAGLTVAAGPLALINRLAGDYARAVQLRERAAGDSRDLAQVGVVSEMCAKNGELVALIERNNAGVQD